MIAIDTNILVHARRGEMPNHDAARRLIAELAAGDEPWGLPWPCVYEFLRVVTHPRVFKPPTVLADALEDLDDLFDCGSLVLLSESSGHRTHMARMMTEGRAVGSLAHDAHIAALLREHGVREFWTTDKDFHRFPGMRVRDPFAGESVQERRPRYRPTRGRRRTGAAR